MYFRLLGAPVVCYQVDGVEVYEPPHKAVLGVWYIATKRLIKVTSYNVRFEVTVVQREPVPLLRIEDVALESPSISYIGITAPFNVDAIKRVIRFAEEVNRMPNYTADLRPVGRVGFSRLLGISRGLGNCVIGVMWLETWLVRCFLIIKRHSNVMNQMT